MPSSCSERGCFLKYGVEKGLLTTTLELNKDCHASALAYTRITALQSLKMTHIFEPLQTWNASAVVAAWIQAPTEAAEWLQDTCQIAKLD